jgi:DNA primase
MSNISGNIIEEVRNYFDIVEVISSYIDLKRSGKNYLGLCPFHSEKTPSFTVTPDKQLFYCFGCQSGGNVFTFIMQIENLTFPEAVRFLADKANIRVDYREMSPAEQKKASLNETLLKINSAACQYFQTMLLKKPEGRGALKHLVERGLTAETISDFQLGYAGQGWEGLTDELQKKGFDPDLAVGLGLLRGKGNQKYFDYFRSRLMFPIFNRQGRILGFGGRIFGQGEPKYLNSPESPLFNKSNILFCLYQALPHIRRDKEALLVEGYMDAIALHQHGFRTAVAPLGTALTEKQIALLRGRVEKITIIFDADESGEKAALRGLQLLKNEGCQVKVARLPQAMDPDDYIKNYGGDRFKGEILEGALPLIDHSLYAVNKKFDLKKKEGRLSYWKEARLILAEIPEALEREEYLKKIAQEINVSLEVLRGDLEKIIKGDRISRGKGPTFKKTVHNEVSLKELAEKELLSSLLQYPVYGKDIMNEIGPEFFTIGPYQEIASCLFGLLKSDQEINLAAIISGFSSQEMHKMLMGMTTPSRQGEEASVYKTIKDCVKKIKALNWAEERERLIKTLHNGADRSELNIILQKIQDLKKLEEGLYCSGEGEDF